MTPNVDISRRVYEVGLIYLLNEAAGAAEKIKMV